MVDNSMDLTPATLSNSLINGEILGYRRDGRPIYGIGGGDGTGDIVVGTGDDDNDDDDSDDSEPEGEEEWKPPTKEEYENLLAKKKKADSEAASRKRWLRENGFDPKTGQPVKKVEPVDDDEDDEDDKGTKATAEKAKSANLSQRALAREIAKTEQAERGRANALISAVPDALYEAGWNGKNMPRMLKLIDLDEVVVESDGEIDGLSDQIEELKKDFPMFFKRAKITKALEEDVPDSKAAGGGKKDVPKADAELTWADKMRIGLTGQ